MTRPELDPLLQMAIASGIMSEGHARDVDAFADGILARGRDGELTEEQATILIERQAVSDALAWRASNRAARRAAAAARRRARK